MKCEKCGNDINPNEKFCTNCGNPVPVVEQPTPEVVTSPVPVDTNEQANRLCIISLILYFGSSIIAGILTFLSGGNEVVSNMFSGIAGLGPLAGIVLMIVARVKYPESRFAKTLMWIYIALTILGIILIVVVIVFFFAMCSQLRGIS